MAKFKNISGKDLSVPGVGIIEAGQIREMPEGFHNANFVEIPNSTARRLEAQKIDSINE